MARYPSLKARKTSYAPKVPPPPEFKVALASLIAAKAKLLKLAGQLEFDPDRVHYHALEWETSALIRTVKEWGRDVLCVDVEGFEE